MESVNFVIMVFDFAIILELSLLAQYRRIYNMPRSRCSSLSCHTVLPEQEHTVLSSVKQVNTSHLELSSMLLTVPYASTTRNDADQSVWVVLVELKHC